MTARERPRSPSAVLRGSWLGGRARGHPLRLHPPQPQPLPLAVVLGLLLRRDRLAPLRSGAGAGGAGDAAGGAARGRLHRPHDLLGPARLAQPAALLQRHLAPLLPDRDDPAAAAGLGLEDRRRRPVARSPGSRRQVEWLAANRDLEGDGLLWIIQPDESGLDASPKFEPVWGWRANAGRASRCSSAATAGSASTPAASASAAGRSSARRWSTRSGRSRCRRCGRSLGDAGPDRAALGRAARPLPRLGRARPIRPDVVDLGCAGAARPARPSRADRPAPGRGAPARRGGVPHPGRAALGRGLGAELRTRRQPRAATPLLARPDLGQLGLARLARPAAGLVTSAEARAPGQRGDRRGRTAKACASTTTRAPAPASAPGTSPGRPWSPSWPSPTRWQRAVTSTAIWRPCRRSRSSASSSPLLTPSATSARRSRACSPRPTRRSRRSSSTTAPATGTAAVARSYDG